MPSRPPSVDAVLRSSTGRTLVARFGHTAAVAAIRAVVGPGHTAEATAAAALARLDGTDATFVRPVLNLTGTVLHTNLGRAVLAEAARAAAMVAMGGPVALEFDLATGGRGERDDHLRALVCELTGAEDAIAVNNNAGALVLAIAALAGGRDSVVSRGELIEIGGAFRLPDIMAAAGTTLVEVGTTNRTHARDYSAAIGPGTALFLKVHTSNYRIEGFTAAVSTRELVALAGDIPVLDDLGSGTLIDLTRFGLPPERTVADAIRDGAGLVTFSGDKLLGGPQAGFIIGRRDLVQRCARHPLKRALRLDKIRLAALEATLRLYRHPERLADSLPTLRHLTRDPASIRAMAEHVRPAVTAWAGSGWIVEVADCRSEVGSGALPVETIPSAGLALRPADGSGRALAAMMERLRALPVPVIGAVREGAVRLDLRCLDDPASLLATLA